MDEQAVGQLVVELMFIVIGLVYIGASTNRLRPGRMRRRAEATDLYRRHLDGWSEGPDYYERRLKAAMVFVLVLGIGFLVAGVTLMVIH